jgi:hypothetical protein
MVETPNYIGNMLLWKSLKIKNVSLHKGFQGLLPHCHIWVQWNISSCFLNILGLGKTKEGVSPTTFPPFVNQCLKKM